jgi:hypothetical protein
MFQMVLGGVRTLVRAEPAECSPDRWPRRRCSIGSARLVLSGGDAVDLRGPLTQQRRGVELVVHDFPSFVGQGFLRLPGGRPRCGWCLE